MATKQIYICHGVQNSRHVEDKFTAYSAKQALYFMCRKYGFNIYDKRVIGVLPITSSYQQIKFETGEEVI